MARCTVPCVCRREVHGRTTRKRKTLCGRALAYGEQDWRDRAAVVPWSNNSKSHDAGRWLRATHSGQDGAEPQCCARCKPLASTARAGLDGGGAQPAQPPDGHSEGDSAPLLASRSPMHFGDVLRQGGVHRGRAGLAQPAALPDLQQIRPLTTLRLLPQRLLDRKSVV